MSDNQVPRIKLDWSQLLGFDQAVPTGAVSLTDIRLTKLGAKFGTKPVAPPPPPSPLQRD